MLCETFWDNLGFFVYREKVMKPNQPTNPLPDFDADLEDDVVWNLLDDASSTNPPPASWKKPFAACVLRKTNENLGGGN
jgi:hypothetical protein